MRILLRPPQCHTTEAPAACSLVQAGPRTPLQTVASAVVGLYAGVHSPRNSAATAREGVGRPAAIA